MRATPTRRNTEAVQASPQDRALQEHGDRLQWRGRHNTPEKVAVAHRKVLLEQVSQSMAFENQPVSMIASRS